MIEIDASFGFRASTLNLNEFQVQYQGAYSQSNGSIKMTTQGKQLGLNLGIRILID